MKFTQLCVVQSAMSCFFGNLRAKNKNSLNCNSLEEHLCFWIQKKKVSGSKVASKSAADGNDDK